ncbi:hypothetical protein APX70_04394, partial [Pseudomonas syringae pv. maculicola]
MIGRQHQQLRIVAIQRADMQRRGGNGRCGIAAEGLKDEIQTRMAFVQQPIVVHRAEIHFPVGDGQQAVYARQAGGTQKSFLQQTFAIGQTHERFGHGFARYGPQACPGAAGDNAG